MDITISLLFFLSLFLVFFTYGGYLVFVLPFIKNRATPASREVPSVTMVIAAYNEEDFVAAKVENCRELLYPQDKLRILFVTDGSTDRTVEILQGYPDVEVMHQPGRNGKTAALNRVMKEVASEITVFSDANTMLNPEALRLMMKHYDRDDVGGVSGEKKIVTREKDGAAGSGEGLYWKYEALLKRADSSFYSLTGAPGELISFRTALYETLPGNVILDDFVLSMFICAKGYRMIYEPGAVAMETASASIGEELKRKIRICAGGFQAIKLLRGRISFSRNPRLFYIYFSHRVMRWAVAPWCLIVLLLSNLLLIRTHPFFAVTAVFQGFFYLQVVAGWWFKDKKLPVKGFFVPYYFFIMNYAAIAGLFKFIGGRQSAAWERSKRATD